MWVAVGIASHFLSRSHITSSSDVQNDKCKTYVKYRMMSTHKRTLTEQHTEHNNTNTMCRCTRLHLDDPWMAPLPYPQSHAHVAHTHPESSNTHCSECIKFCAVCLQHWQGTIGSTKQRYQWIWKTVSTHDISKLSVEEEVFTPW